MTGKVWLVGAGPGDVGLLTLRGREVIENADVIVYDALVGQGVLSLIPESARLIFAGKRAGKPLQPSQKCLVRFGAEKAFSRGKRRQRGNAQIHTNRALVFGSGAVQFRHVHNYTGEPAVRYPGDDSRHDFALKTQGFPHPYPAQTGNADTTTIDPELIIGKRKTVVDAFLAKLRIMRPSGKEVFERCAQLHNRQLRRTFGDFKHPRELFPFDGVQLTAQGILLRLGQAVVCLPCRILFLPLV